MTSANNLTREQLEHAFQVFNKVSEQLTESYVQLQQRISELHQELAAARSERMRQLAEKERYAHRFAQLLDALPAAVVVLDQADRVEQFNPAAGKLLQTIQIGTHWQQIYQKNISHSRRGDELIFHSGAVVSCTEQLLLPEPGRILLLLDISETRQLQARAERQQRLSAMGKMAAQLAHQIRTPLSSALLYTTHLSRADLSAAQREKFSAGSRQTLRQMEQQIEDMLAFSRGGRFEPVPVDLNELLLETAETLEAIADEQAIQVHHKRFSKKPAVVMGNHSALLGAMMNIGLNAKQHCPNGGNITIDLHDAGEEWEIFVSDDGPGVPEEIAEKIFDPFFTTRNRGTGLGLAVCQAVALEHQGRVSVDNNLTGGARFRFALPKAAAIQVEKTMAECELIGSAA